MSRTVLDLSLEEIEEYKKHIAEREKEYLKSRFKKAWNLISTDVDSLISFCTFLEKLEV